MELELKINLNPDGSINLLSYVYASYAAHQDMKSHSRASFTLGTGAIMVCSIKQACVRKSSIETEFISYTDYIGEVMELKNLSQEITRRTAHLRSNKIISLPHVERDTVWKIQAYIKTHESSSGLGQGKSGERRFHYRILLIGINGSR